MRYAPSSTLSMTRIAACTLAALAAPDRLRSERCCRTRRPGRQPAAAGSRRDRHQIRTGRAADRIAGPRRAGARGAGARPRQRRRAQAAVPGRQRGQGRPGVVPDRSVAVPGRAAQRPRQPRQVGSEPEPGRRPGGALQAAGRGERRQQAGIRQRGGGAENRRSRRRRAKAPRCRSPRSTPVTPMCRRRSPGASAARWSPKARWSAPPKRPSWR